LPWSKALVAVKVPTPARAMFPMPPHVKVDADPTVKVVRVVLLSDPVKDDGRLAVPVIVSAPVIV
jgi:hypothetical protein